MVVASTSWVAPDGAGPPALIEVTILAPVELRHHQYDYLPSDIALVTQADYLVWDGYEPFIRGVGGGC